MIYHAPSGSEDERQALRTFIGEATFARTGAPPKTLPDDARQSACPPARVPDLLARNARATASNSMTLRGQLRMKMSATR